MILFILGCATPATFGFDEPTNLSTLFDENTIHPSCLEDSTVIRNTPNEASFTPYLDEGFTRYAQIVAPNRGIIPIFAQDEVSDQQLIRARNILRFFLTNTEDSTFGNDKSDVANTMADNGAVLMMPNGEHVEGSEPRLDAQPLYEDETQVEGHSWFMNTNYEHRDAAFEEIFHLVHDAGIGTYMPGALPSYQSQILAEANEAIEDGRWGIPIEDSIGEWLDDLRREDSLAQEYIVSVIESYYGFWSAWDGDGGMWGIYIASDREEVQQLDPKGYGLVEDFLPSVINTEFRLHPDLNEDFYMSLDSTLPYTHRSQYFSFLTLTGDNNTSLFGNHFDNTLRGNAGDNVLDGVSGKNSVIYCNPKNAYQLEFTVDSVVVNGPEGTDTLRNIDEIHFSDGKVTLDSFTE